MATEVKVLLDTISPAGKRITTFILKYPRYIHSEIMTHRAFSKNASSSRAIPISKIIKQVIKYPVIPIHFGANQSGMSAQIELTDWKRWAAKRLWLLSRWPAIGFAWVMSKIGLHKQITNRILEPWTYITVVLTATEFDNFYALRCDKEHAHPDIYLLAELMLAAHNDSMPRISKFHFPFVLNTEYNKGHDILRKISVARCCRVSYLNLDNSKPDWRKDCQLYGELLKNGHMSPFEHQAVAYKLPNQRSGNFRGWKQYRKTISGEERTNYKRLKRV